MSESTKIKTVTHDTAGRPLFSSNQIVDIGMPGHYERCVVTLVGFGWLRVIPVESARCAKIAQP